MRSSPGVTAAPVAAAAPIFAATVVAERFVRIFFTNKPVPQFLKELVLQVASAFLESRGEISDLFIERGIVGRALGI